MEHLKTPRGVRAVIRGFQSAFRCEVSDRQWGCLELQGTNITAHGFTEHRRVGRGNRLQQGPAAGGRGSCHSLRCESKHKYCTSILCICYQKDIKLRFWSEIIKGMNIKGRFNNCTYFLQSVQDSVFHAVICGPGAVAMNTFIKITSFTMATSFKQTGLTLPSHCCMIYYIY